jgi:ligand-binding sensor domain-containing protein
MRKFYLLAGLFFLPGILFSQSFTNYTNASTSGKLPSDFISSIATDSKGNIWFGTDQGITKFDGVNWATYNVDSGLIDNNVLVIKEDTYGNLWVGAASVDNGNGGVSKFDGEHWHNYDTHDGLISNFVSVITTDSAGNLYFGSNSVWFDMVFEAWDGGVTRFDGFNWTTIMKKERYAFRGLAIDDQGDMWIGNNFVIDILVDSIPPYYSSVLKIKNTDTTVYTSTDGLSGTWISSLVIDKFGNKWITTDNGVSMFDGIKWITYTMKDGLANNLVYDVALDSSGNKWFGTYNGVSKFDGTNWTTYSTQNGLINNLVTEIEIDSKGNKWFGTYSGVSKLAENNITAIKSLTNTYDLKLYPDPVIDKLNLVLSKPVREASIALFNLKGIQLYTEKINSNYAELDMSQFESGIYLVKIIIPGECVITRQLVKQ